MNIFKSIKQKKEKVYGAEKLEGLNLVRKKYSSYNDYLEHQASKLGEKLDQIQKSDVEYEKVIQDRFADRKSILAGKSILCLGARLGGEVRGFKNLGMLAVGIDIGIGENNEHVLYGDFHNIKFPDNIFDFAFTNVVDHVYDLPRFCEEVNRVLRPNGTFYVELGQFEMKGNKYEVIDTRDTDAILSIFAPKFDTIERFDIQNKTSYIDWSGELIVLKKKNETIQ